MNRLSVITITKNAENYIRDFIEAVSWADEIIVLDNMSTDATAKICRSYSNVKCYKTDMDAFFGSKRNYALTKTTGDWILALDADEIVTPELALEIKEAIKDGTRSSYFIARRNMFLGRWIKSCGWWPRYSIHLFRKGAAKWPEHIHQPLQAQERSHTGYLKNPTIHNSYSSLEQYFDKFNFYTTQLASEEYAAGVRVSALNFFKIFLFKPLTSFIKKYFFLKGYRDGFRGFFISFSSGLVIFCAYAKLWEKQNTA